MPDLMTHVAVAHLGRRGAEALGRAPWTARGAALFYAGSVLPDVGARIPMILSSSPDVYWFAASLHSPVAVALQCLLAAALFGGVRMGRDFAVLAAGAGLHMGMDVLQRSVGQGHYLWLFPFSWARWQLPLFWPSDTVRAVPWLLALVLVVELLRWRGRRKALGGS